MKKYLPKEIEQKWQKKWADSKIYQTDLSKTKNKYYCLVELAYTSGVLHIGHWFTFSKGDILARFKRMQGYNVVFPNGYDTFGLPAENAAIKNNMHPKEWTYKNIEKMREQFEMMGTVIDWTKSVITCEPQYYKWNQWLFLKMLEKGVAYRGKTISNWCPSCQTVLADENVVEGKCWRCSSQVVKKDIDQWFLKITKYADELIWNEEDQYDWPKYLKDAQNKWIGKSEGTLLKFAAAEGKKTAIEVFTTRIDTIFGATFLVISPEHPALDEYVTSDKKEEITNYIEQSNKKSEQDRKENKDKTGVFTGSYVINPLNQEKIPVWVADYVLMGYGTGAIMAVPAHDERDFEFAQKFDLAIKTVIEPVTGNKVDQEEFRKSIVAIVKNPTNNQLLSLNWGKDLGGNLFIGGGVEEGENLIEAAKREIAEETGYTNLKFIAQTEKIHHHYFAASKAVNREIEAVGLYFELINQDKIETKLEENEKDKFKIEWLSEDEAGSRVRDELHKYVFDKLVKNIPFTGEGILTDSGNYSGLSSSEAREKLSNYIEENHLGKIQTNYHLHDWSISRQRYWGTPIPIIYCDKCGLVPVPEKDLPVVLPDEVDYSPTGQSPLAKAADWVNVKCPNCGGDAKREVETMDGFIDNSWYFYRYLDPKNDQEIFDKKIIADWLPIEIYIGGSEHTYGHALYSRFFNKFFKDIGLVKFDEYTKRRVHHGVVLGPDGSRMSKSKGNVVDPDEQSAKYGADAVRTYLSFLGPYDIVTAWVPGGLNGVYHFLQRVWGLFDKIDSGELKMEGTDLKMMHKTIKKVTLDLEELANNTAIASLMEWLNYLSKKDKITKEEYQTFLLLLAPFAPHITEELWENLNKKLDVGSEKIDNENRSSKLEDQTSNIQFPTPSSNIKNLTLNWSIHQQPWPVFDKKYLEDEEITIIIQVDGKVKDTVLVDKDSSSNQSVIEKKIRENSKISSFLKEKPAKKVIFVPNKVINFVT